MMGRTHALSGTLAFGGATLAYHYDVPDMVFGIVFATGAALYPDLDHKNATMTKSCGPLSWVICRVFGWIFGGHRHGTHSIFFAALVTGAAHVALTYRHTIAGGIVLSVMMALALASLVRLFRIKGWLDDLAAIVACPVIVFGTSLDLSIVPMALGFGCLVHTVGDCLTDHGCPVFWPVSSRKVTLNLFSTGGTGELIVTAVIIGGIVWIAGLHIYGVIR